MTIKTELIKSYIAHSVCSMITDFEVDEEKVADTVAIRMLGEIQEILNCNDLDDFEKMLCFFLNLTLILVIVTIFNKRKKRATEW